MTWAAVILQLLKLVNWMITKAQQEKWMNEGEQRQIARASAEVVRKQEFARETLKDVERLSDDDVDGLLRTLAGSPEAGNSERQLLSDVSKGSAEAGGRKDPSDPKR